MGLTFPQRSRADTVGLFYVQVFMDAVNKSHNVSAIILSAMPKPDLVLANARTSSLAEQRTGGLPPVAFAAIFTVIAVILAALGFLFIF